MAFKPLPGNQGMIYVPDCTTGKKKHPCPDCFSCQWCGNERCRSCRSNICGKRKKRHHTASGAATKMPVPPNKATESGSSNQKNS